MQPSVGTWQKDEWMGKALESHTESFAGLVDTVAAHNSTTSKAKAQLLSLFWGGPLWVVLFPFLPPTSCPHLVLFSQISFPPCMASGIKTGVFISRYTVSISSTVFILTHGLLKSQGSNLTISRLVHWFLAQGRLFLCVIISDYMSARPHFLSLHLHFSSRPLLSVTYDMSLFWHSQYRFMLAGLVFSSIFVFWAAGDFPYFLVNSVIHWKEYLSFTQNFQVFL